jgi:hypothetical protein
MATLYEPSACKSSGLPSNVMMRKCKVLKGYESDEKKLRTNARLRIEKEYSLRTPIQEDKKFVVKVPYRRYLTTRRIFQDDKYVKDEKKYFRTYFDLMKINVFHTEMKNVNFTCKESNNIDKVGTFKPAPLYKKMIIRQAIIKWDNMCAMPANVDRNDVPYKNNKIPLDVLLVDISAPIESAFNRGFCVMHNRVYEIECNADCNITTHELCFVWDAKLTTCVTNKGPTQDPWIGYADGYYYHIVLIEYILPFQQQIYWGNRDDEDLRYDMGTGECGLNEDLGNYYPGIPFINVERTRGYVYFDLNPGVPANVNKNELAKGVYDMLTKDPQYIEYLNSRKRRRQDNDNDRQEKIVEINDIENDQRVPDDNDDLHNDQSNNIVQTRFSRIANMFEV